MAIVRWEPFRDLVTFQERMNRLFDEVVRGRREDDLGTRGSWLPPVDIYEKDGELVLKAELADMDQKDIDLRVENNTLTIRGERKMDRETEEESFHRIERSYGAFMRSFTLPATIDQDKIKAEYRNGVLRVTLPVREEAKPKPIQVHVS